MHSWARTHEPEATPASDAPEASSTSIPESNNDLGLLERLRTPQQIEAMTTFVEGEPPLLTADSIRSLYQHRKRNGFGPCIIKRGTRIWVDLEKLGEWLETYRTRHLELVK